MTDTAATAAGHDAPLAVGFTGLGDQGLPMAVAIAQAGFELHAWARRAASLDGLSAASASTCRPCPSSSSTKELLPLNAIHMAKPS